MAELVRCKACGYVAVSDKIKEVCPACGVPAKMFAPFNSPISLKRRRILDLHTHPVMVHFPQAFALTLFFLSVLIWFMTGAVEARIAATMQVLSVLLPFAVLASAASGLVDGKIRFRKVTTPLLQKKMVLSLIFFATSIMLACLAFTGNLTSFPMQGIFAGLALIMTLCGACLGLIGGKLLDAKFPG